MPYNPSRHRRRSIRLPGYDYRLPGAYFVTICAQIRGNTFGHVIAGAMEPNRYGEAIIACWAAIPAHARRASLGAFALMPDHLHGIIILSGEELAPTTEGAGARGTTPGSLPAIVQSFKSVSTRAINRMRSTPGARVWQEDYYEHIIRSPASMDRISRYIMLNPARWRQ